MSAHGRSSPNQRAKRSASCESRCLPGGRESAKERAAWWIEVRSLVTSLIIGSFLTGCQTLTLSGDLACLFRYRATVSHARYDASMNDDSLGRAARDLGIEI